MVLYRVKQARVLQALSTEESLGTFSIPWLYPALLPRFYRTAGEHL